MKPTTHINSKVDVPIIEMLRLYVKAKGLSSRELEKEVGISRAVLCRIQRGHLMNATTLIVLLNWAFGLKNETKATV